MMKFSDFKGESALDLLADILDPIAEIASDKSVRALLAGAAKRQSKDGKMFDVSVVKALIKGHKTSIIEIMAALSGEEVDEFQEHMNFLTLPGLLVQLMNDPEVLQLFTQSEMPE